MTTKTEAERLADILDADVPIDYAEVSAELRRLSKVEADHTALLREARDKLEKVAEAMPFPVAAATLAKLDAALVKEQA